MVTGVVVLVVVMAALCAFGIIYKNRNGRLRSRSTPATDNAIAASETLTEAELGSPLGGRATLVQFSTAFCAPCRATRVILGDVAGLVDGVTHVEIDAESRLDLVRRLDIRRTPTVLVLGPDGRIAQRGSGQPRKADVIAALGKLAPGKLAPGKLAPGKLAPGQVEAGGVNLRDLFKTPGLTWPGTTVLNKPLSGACASDSPAGRT